MLETVLVRIVVRVRPQEVDDTLILLALVGAKLYLERTRDLLNALNVLHSWANATVAAEDLAFFADDGRQRHILEHLVNLGEATVRIVNIFTETASTLCSKA